MLVAARLTLAGLPATVMPDGWPDYDLIMQPPNETPQRISVKSRCLSPRAAAKHRYRFSPNGWEWIAFVFVPAGESEQIWILPAAVALKWSSPDGKGRQLPLALLETKLAA